MVRVTEVSRYSTTRCHLTYKPRPIDTADIQLSPEIVNLTQRLAENSHDIWAKQRIADGWIYGPCGVTPKKSTRASCSSVSCPNPRSNMIATRSWKP